jgi:maltose O-acetyltransferase
MRERMLAGELYIAEDPELGRDSARAQRLTYEIGPNVQLLTAAHPLEPGPRRDKWEAAQPIVIGDNVWLGGGVIVCPGVTIGSDTVVGAGSVVVRDRPAGVLAVGTPARVVRAL